MDAARVPSPLLFVSLSLLPDAASFLSVPDFLCLAYLFGSCRSCRLLSVFFFFSPLPPSPSLSLSLSLSLYIYSSLMMAAIALACIIAHKKALDERSQSFTESHSASTSSSSSIFLPSSFLLRAFCPLCTGPTSVSMTVLFYPSLFRGIACSGERSGFVVTCPASCAALEKTGGEAGTRARA